MVLKGIALALFFLILTGLGSFLTFAQAVNATPDSVKVNNSIPATAPKAKEGMTKPNRAALYSAILPGAGQFYNKHYWKVPVIYAIGGALGYFIVTNNREYKRFSKAYGLRIDGDSTTLDEFDTIYPSPNGEAFLKNNRDYYRRNRDLSIILAVLAYGMNIVEANVGAHLNDFDISDDLSLNVQPNVLYIAGNPGVPALSLNLHFKK